MSPQMGSPVRRVQQAFEQPTSNLTGTPRSPAHVVHRARFRLVERKPSMKTRIKLSVYGKAIAVAAAVPTIALVVGAGRKFA
jgi:hypothetical protein